MENETEIFGENDGAKRSWLSAIWRGARKRCPQCGEGRLFDGYTTTAETCSVCGLTISEHRADDAPPYITIMIVGHLIVPLALVTERVFDPAVWVQFAVWGPLILLATLWMLPISKGAMVGLQWAHRMHGFGKDKLDDVQSAEMTDPA